MFFQKQVVETKVIFLPIHLKQYTTTLSLIITWRTTPRAFLNLEINIGFLQNLVLKNKRNWFCLFLCMFHLTSQSPMFSHYCCLRIQYCTGQSVQEGTLILYYLLALVHKQKALRWMWGSLNGPLLEKRASVVVHCSTLLVIFILIPSIVQGEILA